MYFGKMPLLADVANLVFSVKRVVFQFVSNGCKGSMSWGEYAFSSLGEYLLAIRVECGTIGFL